MTVHRTSFNIRFNTMQLHRQLARRALRQDELALLAGVTPSTVSKAVHGGPVSPVTFLRLVKALSAVPVPEIPGGVEMLLADPPELPEQAGGAHPDWTPGGDDACVPRQLRDADAY